MSAGFTFPPLDTTELPGASDTLSFLFPTTDEPPHATASDPLSQLPDTSSNTPTPSPSPSPSDSSSLPPLSSASLSTQSSPAPTSSSPVTPVGAVSTSHVSAGAIAGGVLGALGGVLLLVFALLYVRRRCRLRASSSALHILPTRGASGDSGPYTEPKPRAVRNKASGGFGSRRGHVAQNSSLGALAAGARSSNTLHTLDGGADPAEKDLASVDGHADVGYHARSSSASVPRRTLGSADTHDTLASADPDFVPSPSYPAGGGAYPHRTISATSVSSTVVTDHTRGRRGSSSNPPSRRASARASTGAQPPSPTYPPTPTGYGTPGVGGPPPRPPRSSSRTGSQDSLAERAAAQRAPAATPSSGAVVAAGGAGLARAPSAGGRNKPRKKPVPRYDLGLGQEGAPTLGQGVGGPASPGSPGSLGSVGSGPSSPPGLRGAWDAFEGVKKEVHYLIPDMPAGAR